jgi:hypothetical protein
MPGTDAPAIDPRERARQEREATRQAEREAAMERREREADARRQTMEYNRQQMEQARQARREQAERDREAKEQAKNDQEWEAAKARAKANPSKGFEQQDQLDAIRKSRQTREAGEVATKERAAWLGRRAEQAGQFAQRAGNVAGGLARGGAAAGGAAGLEAVGAGLSRLGPYGMAAAAALTAVTKAGSAASDAMDAFAKRGRELSGYNGQLAGASASADLRGMMADIREADQLGPSLAKLLEQQSKSDAVMRELLNPIKEVLIDIYNWATKSCMDVLLGLLEGINKVLPRKFDRLERLIDKIKKIMEDKDIDSPMDELLNAAKDFVAPAPVGGRRDDAPGALAIPLLKGLR